ncbi:MAG TPA: DinB family protein [Gemmatimonadales bacterium]|nr:DinB family protein [Gemmatimonadales bacterium]
MSDLQTQRARLRADLIMAHQEFHAMANALSERAWDEPSHNPGWTNGQLLFHVLLGFILVPPLARLFVLFDHLPRVCSRAFAAVLNLSTPLFNRINALGPRAAARALGRARILRRFDRVHEHIVARLDRIRPRDWARTMPYPTRWDPRFRSDMRLADLFRYPIDHLRHHRSQLRAT